MVQTQATKIVEDFKRNQEIKRFKQKPKILVTKDFDAWCTIKCRGL